MTSPYTVYELVRDSNFWVAESIDHEGEIYRVTFEGPNSKERAEEYAAGMNENGRMLV